MTWIIQTVDYIISPKSIIIQVKDTASWISDVESKWMKWMNQTEQSILSCSIQQMVYIYLTTSISFNITRYLPAEQIADAVNTTSMNIGYKT